MLLIGLAYGQTPQSFKYQTTVRDNSGNLLSNKLVAFRISLLQGSASGSVTYAERHTVATNDFGIANFNVGQGSVLQGVFSSINWGNGPYFMKIELDLNNGTNYAFMGTNQLLSVPYAMYAANSGNAADDKDKDSTNEIQSLSITGSKLNLSKSNSVTIDTDTVNEIQQLSLQSNQLSLSKNGGVINLTPYMDNNDSQQLSLTGNTLSITKGNSVYLNDVDSTNELQKLTLVGDSLMLSNNDGIVDLKKYATDTQTLSLQGTTLSISRGNSIQLNGAVDLDYDPTNEIQVLTHQNDTLKLSINGGTFLIPSNESVQSGKLNFGNGSGSNAINISMSGYVTTYKLGMPVTFKAAQNNTGHVTLNINGMGAKPLFKNVSDTLVADDIRANQMISVVYDGNAFQFVNVPFANLSNNSNKLKNDDKGGLVPSGTIIASDSIINLSGYSLSEVINTSATIEPFLSSYTGVNFALFDDTIYLDTMYYAINTNKFTNKPSFNITNNTSAKIGQHIYYIRANYSTFPEVLYKYNTTSNSLETINAFMPTPIGLGIGNLSYKVLVAKGNLFIFRTYYFQSPLSQRHELFYYSSNRDTIIQLLSNSGTLSENVTALTDGTNIYVYRRSNTPVSLIKFSDTNTVSTTVNMPSINLLGCNFEIYPIKNRLFFANHMYDPTTNSWEKYGNNECLNSSGSLSANDKIYFFKFINNTHQLYYMNIVPNISDNLIHLTQIDPSITNPQKEYSIGRDHYAMSILGDIYYISVSPNKIMRLRAPKTKYLYKKN